MEVAANVKELHRRWRRRDLVWHWAEILVGTVAWAGLSWALSQLVAR